MCFKDISSFFFGCYVFSVHYFPLHRQLKSIICKYFLHPPHTHARKTNINVASPVSSSLPNAYAKLLRFIWISLSAYATSYPRILALSSHFAARNYEDECPYCFYIPFACMWVLSVYVVEFSRRHSLLIMLSVTLCIQVRLNLLPFGTLAVSWVLHSGAEMLSKCS